MPNCKLTSVVSLIAGTCISLSASGCLEDDGLRTNVTPRANAGEDQELEPDGEFTKVKLDGSGSSDDDGEIVSYRWLNVQDAADAGAVYGRGDFDPDDVESPEVELPVGRHEFILWVTDDGNSVSDPDRVLIKVGGNAAEECVANLVPEIIDAVGMECLDCGCNISDECATAIPECGADCWALIGCIAQNCADETDLTSCAIANCPDSLGGATQAQAAGPCLMECTAECASM